MLGGKRRQWAGGRAPLKVMTTRFSPCLPATRERSLRLKDLLGSVTRVNKKKCLQEASVWGGGAFIRAMTDSGLVGRKNFLIRLVRSHEERRCSNLGPTQSRISPSILLLYEDNNQQYEKDNR